MYQCIVLIITLTCWSMCNQQPIKGTMKLSEQDNGRTLELSAGDTLQVVLAGNQTTGYQWEVVSMDSTVLKQIKEPEFKPAAETVGPGGEITFHFKSIASGRAELKLIYHRPWEKDVVAQKFFEIIAVVK